MSPIFWLKIQIKGRRLSLPIPIILPIAFVLEILALLPMTVYAIVKKETIFLKLAYGFYLSRLIFVFIIHGRGFLISICENNNQVRIIGGS